MTVLVLVLYVLAVMRLTRLINFDMIMDWIHVKAAYKFTPASWQVEFLRCPWCVGMWVALGTTWFPIWLQGLSWWLYPLIALGTSMVVGIAAPLSSDDDEIVSD